MNNNLILLEDARISAELAKLKYDCFLESIYLDYQESVLFSTMETGDSKNWKDYFESRDEVAEKRDGFLKQLWTRILEFIRKVKQVLFGDHIERELQKVDPETKVRVSAPFAFAIKNFKKAWMGVKNIVKNGKIKLKENKKWKIFLAVFGAVAGAVGVAAIWKHRNIKDISPNVQMMPVMPEKPAVSEREDLSIPKEYSFKGLSHDQRGDVISLNDLFSAKKALEDATETFEEVAKRGTIDVNAILSENSGDIQLGEDLIKDLTIRANSALDAINHFYKRQMDASLYAMRRNYNRIGTSKYAGDEKMLTRSVVSGKRLFDSEFENLTNNEREIEEVFRNTISGNIEPLKFGEKIKEIYKNIND